MDLSSFFELSDKPSPQKKSMVFRLLIGVNKEINTSVGRYHYLEPYSSYMVIDSKFLVISNRLNRILLNYEVFNDAPFFEWMNELIAKYSVKQADSKFLENVIKNYKKIGDIVSIYLVLCHYEYDG